jgi:hypothetical protein
MNCLINVCPVLALAMLRVRRVRRSTTAPAEVPPVQTASRRGRPDFVAEPVESLC